MTQTLLENRMEIATAEKSIKLLGMQPGLGSPEEDYSVTEGGPPESDDEAEPNVAPVQNTGEADKTEVEHHDVQSDLIEKFRLARKAADDADKGVFAAKTCACVRHRRVGEVALDLRPTFLQGQWRKWLADEKADYNQIARDRRLAKWLTQSECERLPIQAAEMAIKAIRSWVKEHPNKPLPESLRARLLKDALKEYQGIPTAQWQDLQDHPGQRG